MTPADLEHLIRRDPARRGLLSGLDQPHRCDGHLASAADSLSGAKHVGIVTGFFVPDADPPAAETDGLTGSVLLADVLRSTGSRVTLITDEACTAAVSAAATAAGCRDLEVISCPCDPPSSEKWRGEFWSGHGADLSHLIAIERAAPGWTKRQLAEHGWDHDDLQHATADLPSIGHCHNMRGVDIHDWTAELHCLFEERPDHVTTIGVGDGGNEIGMGRIPWPKLVEAIPSEQAARIAASTATDFTILAGVSDWGAMALAVALCLMRSDHTPLLDWTAPRIERLLQLTVRKGPAIDGITRLPEPTVDGLPFITYIQPWLHIRRELGL